MNAFLLWIDSLTDRAFAAVILFGLFFACWMALRLLAMMFGGRQRHPGYRMPFDVHDDQRRIAENGRQAQFGWKR